MSRDVAGKHATLDATCLSHSEGSKHLCYFDRSKRCVCVKHYAQHHAYVRNSVQLQQVYLRSLRLCDTGSSARWRVAVITRLARSGRSRAHNALRRMRANKHRMTVICMTCVVAHTWQAVGCRVRWCGKGDQCTWSTRSFVHIQTRVPSTVQSRCHNGTQASWVSLH